MNKLVDSAIVLKRINYGEADRIITLLTQKHGKISVIAKGVRKPKSRTAGGLELFTVGSITYIDGKNELKTLVSARVKNDYTSIAASLPATQVAYDIIKYTQSYTESICEDDYFTITNLGLQALSNGAAPAVVAMWYGINILALSGHGINLAQDAAGKQLQSSVLYGFDAATLSLVPNESGTISSQHIKLMRLCTMMQPQKLALVQNVQQLCEDLGTYIQQALQYNSQQSL